MLCEPSPPHIKDLPSIISCEPIVSFKKLSSVTFGGEGYFAAVGTGVEDNIYIKNLR